MINETGTLDIFNERGGKMFYTQEELSYKEMYYKLFYLIIWLRGMGDTKLTIDKDFPPNGILQIEMEDNSAGAKTIGEYMGTLLVDLWCQRESFDSKRPFGNSGWEYEIYEALADAGLIDAHYDECGDMVYEEGSEEEADKIIKNCLIKFYKDLMWD